MYDVLSAFFLRCFLCCFCVYSLADSGERRKPRRAVHFDVREGQDKECVLILSWPSTVILFFCFIISAFDLCRRRCAPILSARTIAASNASWL